MLNNTAIIALYIVYIIGLFQWAALTLVLMEVTVCKDARTVNSTRILNTSLSARLRLFKRSFRTYFYKGSIGLLICSLLIMFGIIDNLWAGRIPRTIWASFSLVMPASLLMLYHHLGFTLTWFRKLGLFFRNQHA